MDVISDIEILESDVKDCDEKCKKVKFTTELNFYISVNFYLTVFSPKRG